MSDFETAVKAETKAQAEDSAMLAPPAASLSLSMEHHDSDLLEGEVDEPGLCDDYLDDSWEVDVTVKMLQRRKDIRNALEQGLRDAFPERFEDAEEISDETIVEMINMDQEVKANLVEILLELTDCGDAEGTTTYYPSISEYSCAEDLLEIERITGFRESREALPFKYEHLRSDTITLLYKNPQILPLISRMKKEQITDALILGALGVTKK